LGLAASGHGVLGHGGVWSDQDWPAVSKKNERDSTKEVVGSVSLLPALLCVDGGHGGGAAWPEKLGSDRPT
jgi:hypothetical protein